MTVTDIQGIVPVVRFFSKGSPANLSSWLVEIIWEDGGRLERGWGEREGCEGERRWTRARVEHGPAKLQFLNLFVWWTWISCNGHTVLITWFHVTQVVKLVLFCYSVYIQYSWGQLIWHESCESCFVNTRYDIPESCCTTCIPKYNNCMHLWDFLPFFVNDNWRKGKLDETFLWSAY